jgi:valyl-tRNA synthetase
MVKDRFLYPDEYPDADRLSAQWTMREVFRAVLGLFAPLAPFVTEDLYQRFYADHEKLDSVHVSSWPTVDPAWRTDRGDIDRMATVLDTVRALRSARHLHSGTRIARLVLDASGDSSRALAERVAEPLRTASRADAVTFAAADTPSGVDGIAVAIEL